LGWRWTGYILAIWVFAVDVLAYFCLPEVYAPFLLKKKAQRLRKKTGDQRWHHPHEDVKLDVRSILTKHLARPVLMLLTEPMVTCIAIYASFVYALLYMTLEVFPIVFEEHRHWSLVVSTTPFLALFVGVLSAVGINLANQPRYARIVSQNNGKPVPEARLPPMVVGGLLFVIGLFWFGVSTFCISTSHNRDCTDNYLLVDSNTLDPLALVRHSRRFHRSRLQRHFSAMHQFPRRHIRRLRR